MSKLEFGHFSGLLCSKLILTFYNPLLIKMCSVQSIDDADASWSQDQWVTYYRKERSQFWCFLGFVRSKLIFHLHESKCLPTFTFYNPLLIKMCSVQSIDDADASWSQETRGDILLQRKVPIWTFLRSPLFKTSFRSPRKQIFTQFYFV